jgi:F0F1-type ATP synthase alpha subunit
MEDKHQALIDKIAEAKKLDDDSESQLKTAIEEFKGLFKN